MADRWLNEIDQIRHQRQKEREREEAQQRICNQRIQQAIDQWDDTIKSLLEHIAEATWADEGRSWVVKDCRREADWPSKKPCVRWTVHSHRDYYTWSTFDVNLIADTDAGCLPKEFVIHCHKDKFHAELTLEDLKSALLKAYEAGPQEHYDSRD